MFFLVQNGHFDNGMLSDLAKYIHGMNLIPENMNRKKINVEAAGKGSALVPTWNIGCFVDPV